MVLQGVLNFSFTNLVLRLFLLGAEKFSLEDFPDLAARNWRRTGETLQWYPLVFPPLPFWP